MRRLLLPVTKAATLACGLLMTLASCATKSPSTVAAAPAPVRFDTLEKVQAGGLSEEDMDVLHAFLRRACGAKNTAGTRITQSQREDIELNLRNYPKPADLAPFGLSIVDGSTLGIIYSVSTDRLYVVDLDQLPSHEPLKLKRTPEGYFFTLIQGCVHSMLKVVTTNGRPYVIKYPESDEFQ